ncbi:MAG TPA: glycoside hydrolase [Phycisphaerae bacterium]|nr:glycoside hydrolase [Phycisphaerae bacterium]HRY68584.1 glycoside hydrolase [Phycisphaerae bacterium]HSA25633.1 glycoside hydrolase [Phycisphaerae bacterium]
MKACPGGYRDRQTVVVAAVTTAFCLTVLGAFADTATRQDGGLWIVENTQLRLNLDPKEGTLSVLDKGSGHEWRQVKTEKRSGELFFKNVRAVKDGLALEGIFGWTKDKANVMTVTLTMPDGTADLRVKADMADRKSPIEYALFFEPFVLDTPQAVMAVADYSDGHLYSLDQKPFRPKWLGGDRLDMPWVGICDLERGMGYAIVLETSDDAVVESKSYKVGEREVHLPRVAWTGSKGTFDHPRRLLYRFTSKGGYVALAKGYREYARAQGLLVTLAEKRKENPNVGRLYGAVDVWGCNDKRERDYASEFKAAGVDRIILHGAPSRGRMQAANEMGYVTSEYDNYTDIESIEAGKQPDSHHDLLPDRAVLKADGERMKAWLTYDRKTQFMKRCPSFWVPTAKLVIPKALQEHPFVGRFIDVTTAEALYECYDTNHPLAKGDKRRCGEELLAYVRSLGLVVGGEHGIWWGVPHLDYIEGMMSSNLFAWPAGHLIRPKSREEKFSGPYGCATWEEWGKWSGHECRAPLWELVFHDCVVSTWYWGDTNDWLMAVDPRDAERKDAFNILYGTIPMLWANKEGSWEVNRELFLRTCRNTTWLHRAVAEAELVDHMFVTADRAVQRTRFSDGTEVAVNFGKEPREVELGGKKYRLPQYGFAAKGPQIEQSCMLIDGKPVTTIEAPGFRWSSM